MNYFSVVGAVDKLGSEIGEQIFKEVDMNNDGKIE